MPIESYVVRALEERKEQRRLHDGFSMDDLFEKDLVSDYMAMLKRWRTFEEMIETKQASERDWLVFGARAFGGYEPFEEERGLDLVRILGNRMKISRKDAKTLVNKLCEELDQIARERDAEPFSQDEKEQLVLAITKTARNLVKEVFKKK